MRSMPKPRKPENKGYPERWSLRHGAIYYSVPKGMEHRWEGRQLFRLGKTASEAYKTWSEKLEGFETAKTIGQLLDRYSHEVIPTKAPKTQGEQIRQVKKLRAVFGHMMVDEIEPQEIYQYVDKRKAKVSAKREIALISHAFTKAVRWGYISEHPFKGEIRFDDPTEVEKPRDRYVEDWEIDELHALPKRRSGNDATLMLQAYCWLKEVTGIGKGDLLRLRPKEDFKDDGIHITRHKTGKKTVYEWTTERRAAVTYAQSVRPVDISPWLFCNKRGRGYVNENKGTCSGFDSMWHRFMDRLLTETKIKERFTEHDIRAKASSDAPDDETARKMMSHATTAITRRVYRRKPEIV
jgi:hypothetical protein